MGFERRRGFSRWGLVLALIAVIAAYACTEEADDDDTTSGDDDTYDPGDPHGLASFAGHDRWVYQGTEVAFVGHGTGDVAELAWDLDGDGTYETVAGQGEVVWATFEGLGSREVWCRVTDSNGDQVDDRVRVKVYDPSDAMRVYEFGPYFVHEQPVPAARSRNRGDYADAWNAAEYSYLTADELLQLDADGFVTQQTDRPQIHQIYMAIFSHPNELFPYVTLDALLHAFHVLYDFSLRVAEEEVFHAELSSLVTALADHFYLLSMAGPTGDLAVAIELDLAYTSVLASLLDPAFVVPPQVQAQVDAEVALIEGAAGMALSNLWPWYQEDY